jgi:hypothetical protein
VIKLAADVSCKGVAAVVSRIAAATATAVDAKDAATSKGFASSTVEDTGDAFSNTVVTRIAVAAGSDVGVVEGNVVVVAVFCVVGVIPMWLRTSLDSLGVKSASLNRQMRAVQYSTSWSEIQIFSPPLSLKNILVSPSPGIRRCVPLIFLFAFIFALLCIPIFLI